MNELELGNRIKQELRNGKQEVRVPLKIFVDLWFGGKNFNDSVLTNKMLDFADRFGIDYTLTIGNNPRYNFWRSFAKRRPIPMIIQKV